MNYFVSYYCKTTEGIPGFGNCELGTDKALSSTAALRELERQIAERMGYAHVTVLNFIKLEDADATQDTE